VDLATLGALCALGSAVAWALTSLLVRSLSSHFGTVALNATRTTLCALLIAAWTAVVHDFDGLASVSAHSLLLLGVSIVTAIASRRWPARAAPSPSAWAC
jgi:drug/metabolite transporter (DMT)-like permease